MFRQDFFQEERKKILIRFPRRKESCLIGQENKNLERTAEYLKILEGQTSFGQRLV